MKEMAGILMFNEKWLWHNFMLDASLPSPLMSGFIELDQTIL